MAACNRKMHGNCIRQTVLTHGILHAPLEPCMHA
jgi:hypothetical protein